jgi:hypothetical protein
MKALFQRNPFRVAAASLVVFVMAATGYAFAVAPGDAVAPQPTYMSIPF